MAAQPVDPAYPPPGPPPDYNSGPNNQYGNPSGNQYGNPGNPPGNQYGNPGNPPGNQYGNPQQQPVITTAPTPMYQTNNTTVVTPATGMVIIQQAPPRVQNYLVLAIFTTLCCNFVIGIIAIVFSCLSQSDASEGNTEGARWKGKVSLGLSISGIISAVAIVIIIIVYFVVVVGTAVNAVSNMYG